MLNKNDKKLEWFKNAKLGLFIHWGLYSAAEGYWNGKETPGIGEWIAAKERIPNAEYEKLADKMTLSRFNPDYWAELAVNAGMKYVVFTAKHHEGFAMFDTEYDDYSIVKRSPCHRDAAREISDSMRKRGIKPCFYYSQAIDFHEENAMGNWWDYKTPESERDFQSYIQGKCKHQLTELLTEYGDIGLIWMDVPTGITMDIASDLKAHIASYQPNCLVSGRIGGAEDMGDYGCLGDNEVPAGCLSGMWETASTMNDTWGYKRDDHNFKSPKEIIELLCSLVSKGANLLLNIGPTAEGVIPPESVYILEELAGWMKINSEAVYNTEASPFKTDFSFGWACAKGNCIYLFVKEPCQKLSVKGIKNNILSVSVLGGQTGIKFSNDEIDLTGVKFGKYVTVIKIKTDDSIKTENRLRQQEKGYILLPACECCITNGNTENKKKIVEAADIAVDAEKYNTASDNKIFITRSGVINEWYNTSDCIKWEFCVDEPGKYTIEVYTLTKKYGKWIGGHTIKVQIGNYEFVTTLTEDILTEGPNRKYFAETGSVIGEVIIDKPCIDTLTIKAEKINQNEPAGLAVSKVILRRSL